MRVLALPIRNGKGVEKQKFSSNWKEDIADARAFHEECAAAGTRTPVYLILWRHGTRLAKIKLRDYANVEGRARALDEAYLFVSILRPSEIFVAIDSYYKIQGDASTNYEGLLCSRSLYTTSELNLCSYDRGEGGIAWCTADEEGTERHHGHTMHDVLVGDLDPENIIGALQYRCSKDFDVSFSPIARAAATVLRQRGHDVEILL